GKDQYFEAAKDSEKLSKIVVVLKNEFRSAGLYLSSFDFDDLSKAVIPKVNEILYDTLAYIVKTDSATEHFLLGTDSVSDGMDDARCLISSRNVSPWGPSIAGAAYSGVDERVIEVKAMEEKVGMHLSQFSLLEDDGVREHHAPVGAPSANAVTSDAPRQVVPRGGGASACGAPAAGRYEAHFSVPTEEFPLGIDLVPVSHYVPAMTLEPLISAVACSFEPAANSFVEPADALEHCSIDEFLADSETDELGQSECEESFAGTLCGQSTGRPQQVIGCGAPPPGLRSNFVLLACFLGLLGIGFAGTAGIEGASGGGMSAADAQPTAVPPPDYWRPEGHYATGYNPHAPLHRAGNNNITDILTQPLPPRAIFYESPSYYGLELQSEAPDSDSG
ncbi:hypothetical protein CYMTET_45058, partial [Cymbomonas tetramitiformis]